MQIADECDGVDTVADVTCVIRDDTVRFSRGSVVADYTLTLQFPVGTSQNDVSLYMCHADNV